MSSVGGIKLGFYRIAMRSATESSGVLDIIDRLQLVETEDIRAVKELLRRIVSMLVQMVKGMEQQQAAPANRDTKS